MAGVPHLQIHAARRHDGGPEVLRAHLALWLRSEYGLDLANGEGNGLQVEWQDGLSEPRACCHLEITALQTGERTTIDCVEDASGCLLFVDDQVSQSASASEVPRIAIGPLLRAADARFEPDIDHDLGVWIGEVPDPVSPGVVLLPVESYSAGLSHAQESLRQFLDGLVRCIVVSPDQSLAVVSPLGYTGVVQGGSALSIARGSAGAGIGVEYVGQQSLRTQVLASGRLLLRHQMAAPIPQDLDRLRREATRTLLQLSNEELVAALQLVEEKADIEGELARVRNELNAKVFELELMWDEHSDVLAQLDAALSRVRFLERALREFGEFPIQEPLADEEFEPETCRHAVRAAREDLSFLVISSLDEPVEALDTNPKRAVWARKIWLGLRALNDYARLKAEGRFRGSLQQYRDDGASEGLPLGSEFAPKESESTESNPDLRRTREFRVDRRINESGLAYMGAHLKIDRGGAGAPRIHFIDDTGGSSKLIHIGYIGPHLPTSSGH